MQSWHSAAGITGRQELKRRAPGFPFASGTLACADWYAALYDVGQPPLTHQLLPGGSQAGSTEWIVEKLLRTCNQDEATLKHS